MLKQYIRDENRNPIGVMLSELTGDEIDYGFSLCHEKDKYDKTKGMLIAFNRLKSERMAPVPNSIWQEWERFVLRSEKYFYVKKTEDLL